MPFWFRLAIRLSGLPQSINFYKDLYDKITDKDSLDLMEWRRVQVRCSNAQSQITADDAYITFDVINYTGGDIDTTWTDPDRNQVVTNIRTFLNVYRTYMSNRYSFDQFRFYRMRFKPIPPAGVKDKPFEDSGPPEAVFGDSMPGTLNTYQAPQVSLTVSEHTPLRAHWGRFYLPGPAAAGVQPNGQLGSVELNAIHTAAVQMYKDGNASELPFVVPVTQHDKLPYRALSSISEVAMDDTYDVIRRRRTKYPTLKLKTGVAATLLEELEAA